MEHSRNSVKGSTYLRNCYKTPQEQNARPLWRLLSESTGHVVFSSLILRIGKDHIGRRELNQFTCERFAIHQHKSSRHHQDLVIYYFCTI